AEDEHIVEILQDYHHKNIMNKKTINKLLKVEHGIQMRGYANVMVMTQCQPMLQLHGSHTTSGMLPGALKHQLVLNQMGKDPAQHHSTDSIKESITFDSGVHLSCDYVTTEMHHQDPSGFELCDPTAKKIVCEPLVALDGHDKLVSIGFLIWGVCDKW
ncbi:hypothetical protein BKA82DRAFT_133044, partial [Pisolithus tinctorius]